MSSNSKKNNNIHRRSAAANANADPDASASASASAHNERSSNHGNHHLHHQNTSLLQQLLNRLCQAHDTIDLDPIQGQFLLEASGGDLDLAVGLYWEDSVAHAARDGSTGSASTNHSDGDNNDASRNASRNASRSNDRAYAMSRGSKNGRNRNRRPNPRPVASDALAGVARRLNDDTAEASGSDLEMGLQQELDVARRRHRLRRESKPSARGSMFDQFLARMEDNGPAAAAGADTSDSAAQKSDSKKRSSREIISTNNSNPNHSRLNIDVDDFIRDLKYATTDSAQKTNNAAKNANSNSNSNNDHLHDDVLANRFADALKGSKSNTADSTRSKSKPKSRYDNDANESAVGHQKEQGNDDDLPQLLRVLAAGSRGVAHNLQLQQELLQHLQQPQQDQQQPQQVAEIEASNVSDDEAAAALAEKLWKQIKPRGVRNKAYKYAIQKQIQKMTRKRRNRRFRVLQQQQQQQLKDDTAMDVDHDNGSSNECIDSSQLRSHLNDGSNTKISKQMVFEERSRKKGNESMGDQSSNDDNDDVDDENDCKPSADSDHESDINEKNAALKSSKTLLQIFGLGKDKGLRFDQWNDTYDKNSKRKRKRNDENFDEDNGDFVSSSSISDGNDSDFEKVNIANFEDAFNLNKYDTVTASQILWGGDQDSAENDTLNSAQLENNENENENDARHDADGHSENNLDVVINEDIGNDKNEDGLEVISNVDANDGANDDDLDDEENSKSQASLFDAVIPRTWLSTGFQLSSCGTGLALPRPVGTELARLRRIQSVNFSRGTSSMQPPLPPYHCGGITALLSIVTALLYTGASIQGNEVNCKAYRKKTFADLSGDERKEEFPERLTDALSALLFIAAKESTKYRLETLADIEKRLNRKRKNKKKQKLALALTYDSDECESNFMGCDLPGEDRELMMKQLMQHRVKLYEVCHWEEKGAGELKVSLDQLIDNDNNLQFSVTMTNSKDLRSFVRANLRSFMGQGGCALFLETIVHIHGIPRLTRILNELRGDTSKRINKSLIRCSCEDKVKSKWEEALLKYQEKAMSSCSIIQQTCDSAPPGHGCISDELISLLLTGKPQKSLHNLSTSNLGFGLLSIDDADADEKSKVNLQSYPEPIWVVRGSSSYSVLWNNDMMLENSISQSSEQSLYPFHLSYWNSWYDPIAKKFDGKVIPERKIFRDNIVPSKEAKQADTNESIFNNQDDFIEVVPHPEDQKYYKDFQHWRFSLSKEKFDNSLVGRNWIPFYRMSRKEKKLVEMKMAPQINRAIWSLWPGSEIEWKPSAKLIS